jgi:hypothetical protein
MTLSELADYTCAKVGQTDEDSLGQCKRFLNARLRMIWDSALWRDSLCLATVSLAARQSWIILPASIERVLKLRAGSGAALPPLESALVFDYSPDLFDSAGDPLGFAVFAPVVHGPCDDAGDALIVTEGSGASVARDAGRKAFIEVEQADGTRVTETLLSSGSGYGVEVVGRFIVRFSKEVTAAAYQVGFADGTPLSAALPADETQFPRRARVRLVWTPTAALEVLALGKRSYPGLLNDFESPALSNVDNALLAYAMADMLERQRQYAKAQLKLQEAQAQMAILHDLERNQSACESRLVPAMY